jgi:hypothetical protein
MQFKSFMEALKGKQHKIDKNKNGKIDAHDFKLLRKEDQEITEAKVETKKYSWGTMKTIHHGADFSIPLHPEHHQAIAKLGDEGEHKFKDETGRHWTARRKGDDVHFHSANDGPKTVVKHDALKESEERMARADYKVGPSGRKSHKEIVFNTGNENEKEKEDVKEAKMTDDDMVERERIVKGMKKNYSGFKARYGDRAKEVMYATATKQAMKEEAVDESVQKADIPAYLRKQQGQTPLKLSDLKRKDTISDKENLAKLRNEETKYVVHYTNDKGEHVNSSKAFDDKAKADAHAAKGNAMDKVGGKYSVKAIQNEEKPPFDGPYTKVKPETKDKSGAVHTPMSRAKHLARMAMKKQMKEDIDRLFEAKDEQEYGYEGDMAMNQLATLTRCAEMIKDTLKPDTDLPEWVQSKITLATDYIVTAADYLHSELDEQAPVAPVPGQKWKDHAVMVNGKQRVVIKRANAKNYPEHEGWKEVSPGQKLKEDEEVQFSYNELMMIIEARAQYLVKATHKGTGRVKVTTYVADKDESEYGVKSRAEREHKPNGYQVDSIRRKDVEAHGEGDEEETTQKRGRGRPAGAKSGARGPRIK